MLGRTGPAVAVRPRAIVRAWAARRRWILGALAVVALTVPGLGLLADLHAPPGAVFVRPSLTRAPSAATATSVVPVGTVPSEVRVGTPVSFEWEALGIGGTVVTDFAVSANLSVTASANGSVVRAWVNSTATGPISRSTGGTFVLPASDWSEGVLPVSVSVGAAVPTTVRLTGSLLPSTPAPAAFEVDPDLDHLVLYSPTYQVNETRTNHTFWLVRDPFGDPTPGAELTVVVATNRSLTASFVPVNWTADGATGAWVNYTIPGTGPATVSVRDGANATLLGPIGIPAIVPAAIPPAPAPSLSSMQLVVVALLGVGGVGAIGTLLAGGRPRARAPGEADGEEELQRLAEGRATIVELVRRAGSLGLSELEAGWEPPPAPPALADWVASLVTDGTLTATLDAEGRARFALAGAPTSTPHVTLDEEALAQGIARRDAAVETGRPEETSDEP